MKDNLKINQTLFKINKNYGFDSIIFSVNILTLINAYINI